MSVLRPTLGKGNPFNKPCMTDGTAYLMILSAVKSQGGLVHGKLTDDHGAYCAIGSYFEINKGTALPQSIVDEVAAVNDSVPHFTAKQRKGYVAKWLRWKLGRIGLGPHIDNPLFTGRK